MSLAQTQQMMSPTKEINGVSMCKKGQEYVQELFQKTHDIFKYMTTKGNQVSNIHSHSTNCF